MAHVDQTIASGLSKFSIPLIAKVYPALVASKMISVQPMQGLGPLIYLTPASQEVIGAILLWFKEMFPYLKIKQHAAQHHLVNSLPNCKQARLRVAVLEIWDGRVDFVHDKFEMSDPEMFIKLHKAVVEYFRPVRSDDNEHTRNSMGV